MNRQLLITAVFSILILLIYPATGEMVNARETESVMSESDKLYELEFKNALLGDVIRVIAEQSGRNIIATEKAFKKQVTIYLKNVTVREAVESICRINDLWYREDKNGTYRILTTEEYRQDLVVHKDDDLRVFRMLNPNTRIVAQAIEDLYGPRVILSLGLDPAQEQEFILSGTGGGGRFGGAASSRSRRNIRDNRNQSTPFSSGTSRSSQFGGRGGLGAGAGTAITDREAEVATELTVDQIEALGTTDTRVSSDLLQDFTIQASPIFVTVNNEHNMIIVRTSDKDAMTAIASLVEQLDKPVPQVLLEMKVLDVLIDDDFRSLLNLSVTAGESDVTDPVTGDFLPSNSFLLGNFPLEGGSFVYQFISDRVNALLETLIINNRINVLSKPIILASNNRPAELFVGEETVITTGVSNDVIVNQTSTNTFIDTETEVREVGNQITITPFINDDDSITLAIEQETSSVNRDGATVIVQDGLGGVTEVPIDTVNTANVNGTIVAKHGYTMAVGGLIRNSKTKNTQKVPVLGDIPLLGAFFRREVQGDEQSELILLITPYVMRKGEEYETVSRERVIDPSHYSEWNTEDDVPPKFIKPPQRAPRTIEEDLRIYEENTIRPEERSDYQNQDQVKQLSDDGKNRDAGYRQSKNPVVELTEAAARIEKPVDARRIPVDQDVPAPLFLDRKLVAYPLFTWKYRDLYVTRITVRNISNKQTEIRPQDLRGSWLSASFDAESLAPESETVGYLVSDADFSQSIARTPASRKVKQVIIQ